jgi:hypothetical protein
MFQEAGRDHGPLRMILNRNDGGFGAQRAVVAFDKDAIGKFQRVVDHKQNFARRAELDDGVLKKNAVAFAGTGVCLPFPLPFSLVRLSLIGIRTGVASGKNLAKRLRCLIRAHERLPGWALKPQSRGS